MAGDKYMRLPTAIIPQEVIDEYNLSSIICKDHVYIEIRCGMHGLPQAVIIANQLPTQ
jgi:hypothetical protein